MARVTVEDCIDKVDNRYELVALAARRAKDISSGAPLTVERDNDKDAVVALREIADETVLVPDLRENLINANQRRQNMERFIKNDGDDASTEVEAVFAEEQDVAAQPAGEAGGISFADDNVEVED